MKKVLCVTLALVMSLFICACSGGTLSSDSKPSDDKKDANETILEDAV